MGFAGHVACGLIYVVFGLRWMYCVAYRYQLCQRGRSLGGARGYRFRSSMFFPVARFPGKPVMPLFLMASTGLYALSEVFAAYPDHFSGQFTHHVTMGSSFVLLASGVIVHHYTHVLPLMDYACGALAMFVNVLLFLSHKDGRNAMDLTVHHYLFVSYAWLLVMALVEMRFQYLPTVAFVRSLAALTTGTWLWHISFVLFSRFTVRWPANDHEAIMITHISYTWHIMANAVLMALIFLFVRLQVHRMSPSEVDLGLEIEYSGQSAKPEVAYKKLTGCKEQDKYADSEDEFCC